MVTLYINYIQHIFVYVIYLAVGYPQGGPTCTTTRGPQLNFRARTGIFLGATRGPPQALSPWSLLRVANAGSDRDGVRVTVSLRIRGFRFKI